MEIPKPDPGLNVAMIENFLSPEDVAVADGKLATRFSAAARIADYRRIFNGVEI